MAEKKLAQIEDYPGKRLPMTTSQKLKQRNRELAILKAIVEELNQAVTLKNALENSLGLVAELLELKAGWVWLLDEDSGEPYLAASRMLPPFLAAKPSRMRGKNCLCLLTFMAGDLVGAENINVLECSRLSEGVDGTNGLKYHASIPIYAHDKPLGVMNVASSDWRELEPDDLQLLYTIGTQIGIAVERFRLFDQNARLATIEERNHLAREIHDTIAQGMAAAILNLESAEALLDDPDPARQARARQKLSKALELVRANLEEARHSVLDLRVAPYLDKPLAEALNALVNNFGSETELETHFEVKTPTLEKRYSSRIEIALYRIAQESLANVRKHAEAHKVRVILTSETKKGKEHLHLIIQDDGKGFDPACFEPQSPADPNKLRGWGLTGMNERLRHLDGQLILESCPGEGTRIEAVVPVN